MNTGAATPSHGSTALTFHSCTCNGKNSRQTECPRGAGTCSREISFSALRLLRAWRFLGVPIVVVRPIAWVRNRLFRLSSGYGLLIGGVLLLKEPNRLTYGTFFRVVAVFAQFLTGSTVGGCHNRLFSVAIRSGLRGGFWRAISRVVTPKIRTDSCFAAATAKIPAAIPMTLKKCFRHQIP